MFSPREFERERKSGMQNFSKTKALSKYKPSCSMSPSGTRGEGLPVSVKWKLLMGVWLRVTQDGEDTLEILQS